MSYTDPAYSPECDIVVHSPEKPIARRSSRSPAIALIVCLILIAVTGPIASGALVYMLTRDNGGGARGDHHLSSGDPMNAAPHSMLLVALAHHCGSSCAAFPCPPNAFCNCEPCFSPPEMTNSSQADPLHEPLMQTAVYTRAHHAAAVAAALPCSLRITLSDDVLAAHSESVPEMSDNDDGLLPAPTRQCSGEPPSLDALEPSKPAANTSNDMDIDMDIDEHSEDAIQVSDALLDEGAAVSGEGERRSGSSAAAAVNLSAQLSDFATGWKLGPIGSPSTTSSRRQELFPEARIVGGTQQAITTSPWQVHVQLGGFMCGGSILNDEWILTAAHCCVGKSVDRCNIRVMFGQTSVVGYGGGGGSCDEAASSTTHRCVNAKYEHPSYSTSTLDHDLCLLRLAQPLPAGGNWQAIPLASSPPVSGSSVEVTGWGSIYSGGPSSSTLLRADLVVVSSTVLRRQYPYATSGMIGAYAPGKDSCQGDSGGPLIVRDEVGVASLVGVVSFGNGCAAPGYSGVYFHPAAAIEWLRDTLSAAGTCSRPAVPAPVPVPVQAPIPAPAPAPVPQPVPRPPQPVPSPPSPPTVSGGDGELVPIGLSIGGGSYPYEKWASITTAQYGRGTTVWASGSTCGAGAGTGRGVLYVPCGVSLWFNAYDAWGDGWDGSGYIIIDSSGELIANNGGWSPDNGRDDDHGKGFNSVSSSRCADVELETSEQFVVPCSTRDGPLARLETPTPTCGSPRIQFGDCEETAPGGLFEAGSVCTPRCAAGRIPSMSPVAAVSGNATAADGDAMVCRDDGQWSTSFECCAPCGV